MKCYHPKRIWNKYIHEYILTPCGECAACRISKGLRLSGLVRNEMKRHKYNIFFTLTYDNDHIPCIHPSDEHVYRGIHSSEIIGELPFILDVLPYPVYDHGFVEDSMSVFFYKDVQDFLKRLRNHLNYTLYDTKKAVCSFRYFVCAEYGTKHYRSHMHGIIHVDNKREADEIIKAIPSLWKLCDWDALYKAWLRAGRPRKRYPFPQFCSTFASSYVASYVSCASGVGLLAEVPEFRPFCKYSKRPVYGLSQFDCEVLDELRNSGRFDGRFFRKVYKDKQSFTYDVVSLRFLSSFFPRSTYFDKLSDKAKRSMYWFVARNNETGEYFSTESLKPILCKDGGDSLTNHVLKILHYAERLCMLLFNRFLLDDWFWYLDIRQELQTKHASAMLFLDMSWFKGNDFVDYVHTKYKSFLGNKPSFVYLLSYVSCGVLDYDMMNNILSRWQGYLSSYHDCVERYEMVQKFKDMLLPKHINSFINNLTVA